MGTSKIKIIPTPYQEVMSLLKSEALRAVEEAVAPQVGLKILRDYDTASTSYTQAEMSVSGMSPAEIERSLLDHRDKLVSFGVRFLKDPEATKDEEEFPEGEEPDEKPGNSQTLGLGTGFGIKIAIYYNFLANRPLKEFHEFLKNRAIPYHTKFARELRRVFDEVAGSG